MHICTNVYMYVYMHVCTMFICIHVCIHAYMFICIHVVCIHAYMFICIHVCIHAYMVTNLYRMCSIECLLYRIHDMHIWSRTRACRINPLAVPAVGVEANVITTKTVITTGVAIMTHILVLPCAPRATLHRILRARARACQRL